MAGNFGIWIDRREAYVISLGSGGETVTRLESGVEGRVRPTGGSRSRTIYGPQDVAAERNIEEKHKQQLRRYYRDIIDMVEGAEKILIFGPGEAKQELAKEMGRSRDLPERIAALEPADKMTERQMAAKVREYFA